MTLQMMLDFVNGLVSPAERLKFLDAVIFNVLICNSDSHTKNYSVLIGADGSAKIGPPAQRARRARTQSRRVASTRTSSGSLQSAAREFYKRSDIMIICGA